jgi:hypothetical protein
MGKFVTAQTIGDSMQNGLTSRYEPMLNQSMFSHAPDAEYRHDADAPQEHSDHQFVAMLDSYRDSGGLARAQEVAALLKRRCGGDLATLASWIVNQKVICFEWQTKIWLPLFQFNRLDMTLQPGLGQVLAQLRPAHDTWRLANWFAQPNAWLRNRKPAIMLGLDRSAVLNAARAEQLIANG